MFWGERCVFFFKEKVDVVASKLRYTYRRRGRGPNTCVFEYGCMGGLGRSVESEYIPEPSKTCQAFASARIQQILGPHMIDMGIAWKESTKDSTSESPHAKKKSEMPGVCVCVRDETILL